MLNVIETKTDVLLNKAQKCKHFFKTFFATIYLMCIAFQTGYAQIVAFHNPPSCDPSKQKSVFFPRVCRFKNISDKTLTLKNMEAKHPQESLGWISFDIFLRRDGILLILVFLLGQLELFNENPNVLKGSFKRFSGSFKDQLDISYSE